MIQSAQLFGHYPLVLLVAYIGDQAYSSQHPNSGHGITDTGSSSVQVKS